MINCLAFINIDGTNGIQDNMRIFWDSVPSTSRAITQNGGTHVGRRTPRLLPDLCSGSRLSGRAKILRIVMKRFVGALGVAIPTYMVYKHQTDEGFRRATRLYSVAGPVVLAYRFTELKHQMMPPKSQEASDAEPS